MRSAVCGCVSGSEGVSGVAGFSVAFRGSILILSAAPCASILLNLAEIHENGREPAAACALLTTLLSIVTIPLLSFLL